MDRPLLLLGWLLVLATSAAWTPQGAAQERPGSFGIGGQVGDRDGLSVKLYTNAARAYEAAVAVTRNASFWVDVHRLRERALDDSLLRLSFGPGLLVGSRRRAEERTFQLGTSVSARLNFFTGRFEVGLAGTPRLALLPSLHGGIGGSVALRYYP